MLLTYTIKDYLLVAIASMGAAIAYVFGGWNSALTTLVVLQALDYITGMMVAGVFKNSQKTDNGGISSKVGWAGLCKKFVVLMFVFIAYRMDLIMGTAYLKDGVCVAYIVNEAVSLIENAGLMGVPIPACLASAIDALREKETDD